MTALLQPRRHPLDCGRGCVPPQPHDPIPQDRADHKFLAGDRWVCEHGAGYVVARPYPGEAFRRWQRLGWLGSLFARRDVAKKS